MRASPAQRMNTARIISTAMAMKLVPKTEFASKDKPRARDPPLIVLNSHEAALNVQKISIVIMEYSAMAKKLALHMPALLGMFVHRGRPIVTKMTERAPKAYATMQSMPVTPEIVSKYVKVSRTKTAETSKSFVTVPLPFTATTIRYQRMDSVTATHVGSKLDLT